jgi:hypothetical protein
MFLIYIQNGTISILIIMNTSNITKSGAINTYSILSNKAGARSFYCIIITFKNAMANKLGNPTYYMDLKCNIE